MHNSLVWHIKMKLWKYSLFQTWFFFRLQQAKKLSSDLEKIAQKASNFKLQNVRNQVQIDRGLDYSKVCIYFKLTVSILIGQNVVRHVVLEHKLGRSRLMHKMMAKPVTKMTWREFAEWKNAKVRCRKFGIYFHLMTEHVNILKCHSHNICAALVDFYITLTYSYTKRKSDKKYYVHLICTIL